MLLVALFACFIAAASGVACSSSSGEIFSPGGGAFVTYCSVIGQCPSPSACTTGQTTQCTAGGGTITWTCEQSGATPRWSRPSTCAGAQTCGSQAGSIAKINTTLAGLETTGSCEQAAQGVCPSVPCCDNAFDTGSVIQCGGVVDESPLWGCIYATESPIFRTVCNAWCGATTGSINNTVQCAEGANCPVAGCCERASDVGQTVSCQAAGGATLTYRCLNPDGPVFEPVPVVPICPSDKGAVGADYASRLNATGGSGSYSFAASPLPSWASLNAGSGLLAGTPTVGGPVSFSITATDSVGASASTSCTIVITAPPVIQCEGVLDRAQEGVSYPSTLVARGSGGAGGPFTYSAVSGLPSGLSLSSAGFLSGTPSASAPGSYSIVVRVQDQAGGFAVVDSCPITVINRPSPSCPSPSFGFSNVPYQSLDIVVTGGTGQELVFTELRDQDIGKSRLGPRFTPRFNGGSFLSGLLEPVTQGDPFFYSFTVAVTDSGGGTGSRQCQLLVHPPPRITCPSQRGITIGEVFSSQASLSGGDGNFVVSLTGTSLLAVTNNGQVSSSGVALRPAQSISYTLTARSGSTHSASCTLQVLDYPSINCPSLPTGQVGAVYGPINPVTNVTSPNGFGRSNGNLPPGITVNSNTGVIASGSTLAANAVGTYTFRLTVSDLAGKSATSEMCSIVVQGPPLATCPADEYATTGDSFSDAIGATGGTPPYKEFTILNWSGGAQWLTVTSPNAAAVAGPAATGTFTYRVLFKDDVNVAAASELCRLTVAPPPTFSCPSSQATVSALYRQDISATNGAGPLTWSLTGNPGWLSISTRSNQQGRLTGTPPSAGTVTFTIRVEDSNGQSATQSCSIVASDGPTKRCPDGGYPTAFRGTPYTGPVPSGSDGAGPRASIPYTLSGSLPRDLTLDRATGIISGTIRSSEPTRTYNFDLSFTDLAGTTVTFSCSIVVADPFQCPTNTGANQLTASVGRSFSTTIVPASAQGPFTFALSGLPPGMSWTLSISNAGVLSGTVPNTPADACGSGTTAPCTFSYTVTITDSTGAVQRRTCSLSVRTGPDYQCVDLSLQAQDSPQEFTFSPQSGSPPFTFTVTVTPNPPADLTVTDDGSTATVRGTFDTAANYTYCITVTDFYNVSSTNSCCNLRVLSGISFVCPPRPAITCSNHVVQFEAVGGSGSYEWFGRDINRQGRYSRTQSSSDSRDGIITRSGTYTLIDTVTEASFKLNCAFDFSGPWGSCPVANGVGSYAGDLVYEAGRPFCYQMQESFCTGGCEWFQDGGSSETSSEITVYQNGTICGTGTNDNTLKLRARVVRNDTACHRPIRCDLTKVARTDLSCPNGLQGNSNAESHLELIQGQRWRVDPLGNPFYVNTYIPTLYLISTNMSTAPTIVNGDDDIELSSAQTLTIAPGSYTYTIIFGPNPGVNLTTTCPLTVWPPASLVCPPPNAVRTVAYSGAVTGTGAPTLRFSLRNGDNLPDGLSLAQDGTITGTPTKSGSFSQQFRVLDKFNNAVDRTCPFIVTEPHTAACPPMSIALVGESFSSQATSANCVGTCTFATQTSLPASFTLSNSGVLEGPSPAAPAGITQVVIQVTDPNTTAVVTITCPLQIAEPPTGVDCPSQTAVSVGQQYRSTPTIQGGAVGAVEYRLHSGLLPGGVNPPVRPGDGLMLGTASSPSDSPTFPVRYTFKVNATDAGGQTAVSADCTIDLYTALLLPCPAIGPLRFNESVTVDVEPSGGLAPYVISISFNDAFVTLTGASLNVSPTANDVGAFRYRLTVTDGAFGSRRADCSFIVNAQLAVSCPTPTDMTVGVPYSQLAEGRGGRGAASYTYSISAVAPTGTMNISSTTGRVQTVTPFSAPTSGSFIVSVSDTIATVNSGACPFNVVAVADLTCPTTVTGAVTIVLPGGAPSTFSVAGGVLDGRSFTIEAGALPNGVTLNATTGLLSGTPTASGTFNYTTRYVDSAGSSSTRDCALLIRDRPVAVCPTATASVTFFYSSNLTATGGTPPSYTFSIIGGALPQGLSLTVNQVTGTPTFTGSSTFTISVADSAGLTGTAVCVIQVSSPGCESTSPTTQLSNAANRCRDCATCKRSANPCFSKQCALNTVLLLDESASLTNFRDEARRGVLAFIQGMQNIVNVGGTVNLGVIRFGTRARNDYPLRPMTAAYVDELTTFVNDVYLVNRTLTNWADALNLARTTDWGNVVDVFVLFTDGNPQSVPSGDTWTCAANCYNYQQDPGKAFFSDLCKAPNACTATGSPEPEGLTFETTASNELEGLWAACTAADKLKETGSKVFLVGVGDVATNEDEIQVITGLREWNQQPETFFTSDYVVDTDYERLPELFQAVGVGLCPCLASYPTCVPSVARPSSCSSQLFSARVQVTTRPGSTSTTFPPASTIGAYIYYQFLGGAAGRVGYDYFQPDSDWRTTATPTLAGRKDILNPCKLQRVVQCDQRCFTVQEKQNLPRFFREEPDTAGTAGSLYHDSTVIAGCTGFTKVYPAPQFLAGIGTRSPETIKYFWTLDTDGVTPCAAEAFDGTFYEFYKDRSDAPNPRGVFRVGETPFALPANTEAFDFVAPPTCTAPSCARAVEMVFVIDEQNIAQSEIASIKNFVGRLIFDSRIEGSRFGVYWTGAPPDMQGLSAAFKEPVGSPNPTTTNIESLFVQQRPLNGGEANFAKTITDAVNLYWPVGAAPTGVPRQLVTIVGGPDNATDTTRWATMRNLLQARNVEYWAVGVNVGASNATLLGEMASINQYVHVSTFSQGSFLSIGQPEFSQRLCPAGNLCGDGCKGFCGCEAIDTCVCPACAQDNCTSTPRMCINIETGCNAASKNCNDPTGPDSCTKDTCDLITGCSNVVNVTCDDNNECTSDSCDGSDLIAQCRFLPKLDPGTNKCLAGTCNPNNGSWSYVDISANCDDGDLCTADSCDPNTGCVFTNISATCNDGNMCTADSCSSQTGCVYTNISASCNDNSECTVDSCDMATGCVFTNIVCNDTDLCTTDSCNPAVGCVYSNLTANACTDNDACTIDFCDSSLGCRSLAIDCDDGNSCTVDTCSPISGCIYTPKDCNDNDDCTNDSCDTDTVDGECVNEYDPTRCAACGIFNCTPTANACQADGCVDQSTNVTCANALVPDQAACNVAILTGNRRYCYVFDLPETRCDDNNACTTDSCNTTTGCVNTAITCSTGNMCLVEGCDPLSGCITPTPVTCDDGLVCTTDSCNITTGCLYEPITCDDQTVCTSDTCEEPGGCKYAPITCNDNNVCTIDTCDPITGCNYEAISCDDNNACTTDTCDTILGCQHTAIGCNDNVLCTTDTCDNQTGCVYTQLSCQADTNCSTYACVEAEGRCVRSDVPCDDGNLCTADTCSESLGGCQYTNIECFSPSQCEEFECAPATGLCTFAGNRTCNDNSSCTADSCLADTGCVFRPIACPPGATPCLFGFFCDGSGPVGLCIYANVTSLIDLCGECLGDNTGCFFSSLLGAGEISAITGGVVAGIVVAAVVAALIAAYLSKKGYDYYSNKSDMTAAGAHTNPYFVSNELAGEMT